MQGIASIAEVSSRALRQKAPGYAILITGEWGTGKTFQVRKALPNGYAHYVSLFGLKSAEEVDAVIFSSMYPKEYKAIDLAKKADSTTVELPFIGAFGLGGIASAVVRAIVHRDTSNQKPIIFDDLERSSLAPKEVLGIINRYVEHSNCRVIVLAHDKKLVDEFDESKEKIFGLTIRAEPNIDEAFKAFCLEQDPKNRFGSQLQLIIHVFRESEASSLRVLRHVIEDVRRLLGGVLRINIC